MPGENRLIDSNILVYGYDVSEGAKHQVASALLADIWDHGGGVVTLQNLSEFFVAVTGKVQRPIPLAAAKTVVSDILHSARWIVIDRQAHTVLAAMDLVDRIGAPQIGATPAF